MKNFPIFYHIKHKNGKSGQLLLTARFNKMIKMITIYQDIEPSPVFSHCRYKKKNSQIALAVPPETTFLKGEFFGR